MGSFWCAFKRCGCKVAWVDAWLGTNNAPMLEQILDEWRSAGLDVRLLPQSVARRTMLGCLHVDPAIEMRSLVDHKIVQPVPRYGERPRHRRQSCGR